MLPDFPETKRMFAQFFQTYMRTRAREISPFGMVQTRHLYEGRSMKITRADKSETETGTVRLSTQMEIGYAEVENLTLETVIKKYDEIVLDMVRKQADFVRERLTEDLPESQTVQGAGKKFGPQLLFEVMERMQIEFYADGRPHEIYVDGPQFAPDKLDAIFKEIDGDPELSKKFEELINKKKEDWRAREADRKLVG